MKRKYNGHSKKGGVYKITNLVTGMFYVGSAKCFQVRASQHLTKLRQNKHSNKHLQHAFNKHGKDEFLFEVVEVVIGDKGERFVVEQQWIDQFIKNGVWDQTYNFKKKAEQKERECYSRTPEETKKILSAKSKAMWKDLATRKKILKRKNEAVKTPEYKKALKEGLEKAWDDEARRKKTSKRLKDEHEAGSREHVIEILKKNQKKGRETFKERMKADTEFKKKYQEHGKTKVAKIQERYKKDANFRKKMDAHSRKNITDYNESRELTKKPTFVGPNGKVYDNIYNLAEFARNNGLDLSCAYKLVNGKLKKHRGWKLFTS